MKRKNTRVPGFARACELLVKPSSWGVLVVLLSLSRFHFLISRQGFLSAFWHCKHFEETNQSRYGYQWYAECEPFFISQLVDQMKISIIGNVGAGKLELANW
jgi:hypothetical protein